MAKAVMWPVDFLTLTASLLAIGNPAEMSKQAGVNSSRSVSIWRPISTGANVLAIAVKAA